MNCRPLRSVEALEPPEAWDVMPAIALYISAFLLVLLAEEPSPLTKRTLLVPRP